MWDLSEFDNRDTKAMSVMSFEVRFNFRRSLHQILCLKLSHYKCAYFLLFWLLSTLSIYQFHCYSMSLLLLYLSFHLDSLHCHPDSPYFSHFNLESTHSQADSPHPHSHFIPCIPILILHISLIAFRNSSFCLLEIACSFCNL